MVYCTIDAVYQIGVFDAENDGRQSPGKSNYLGTLVIFPLLNDYRWECCFDSTVINSTISIGS